MAERKKKGKRNIFMSDGRDDPAFLATTIDALQVELAFYRDCYWRRQQALENELHDPDLTPTRSLNASYDDPQGDDDDDAAALRHLRAAEDERHVIGLRLAMAEAHNKELELQLEKSRDDQRALLKACERKVLDERATVRTLHEKLVTLRHANHVACRHIMHMQRRSERVETSIIAVSTSFLEVSEKLWRSRIEAEAVQYLVLRAADAPFPTTQALLGLYTVGTSGSSSISSTSSSAADELETTACRIRADFSALVVSSVADVFHSFSGQRSAVPWSAIQRQEALFFGECLAAMKHCRAAGKRDFVNPSFAHSTTESNDDCQDSGALPQSTLIKSGGLTEHDDQILSACLDEANKYGSPIRLRHSPQTAAAAVENTEAVMMGPPPATSSIIFEPHILPSLQERPTERGKEETSFSAVKDASVPGSRYVALGAVPVTSLFSPKPLNPSPPPPSSSSHVFLPTSRPPSALEVLAGDGRESAAMADDGMTPSQRLANQLLAKYWTKSPPAAALAQSSETALASPYLSGGVRASALVLDPLVQSNRRLKAELQQAKRAAECAREEMQTKLERMRIEHEQQLLERESVVLEKEEQRLSSRKQQKDTLLQEAKRNIEHNGENNGTKRSSKHLAADSQHRRANAAMSTAATTSIELSPQSGPASHRPPFPTNDPQVDEMLQSLYSAKLNLLH